MAHTRLTLDAARLDHQDIEDLAAGKRLVEHLGRQMAGRDQLRFRRRRLVDLRPAAEALGLALLTGYAAAQARDE